MRWPRSTGPPASWSRSPGGVLIRPQTLCLLPELRERSQPWSLAGEETRFCWQPEIAHLKVPIRHVFILPTSAQTEPSRVAVSHLTPALTRRLATDPEFAALRSHFGKARTSGQRSIILVELTRISDSCGWSVPLLDFRADRDILDVAQERRSDEHFHRYWAEKNAVSIDGLPALDVEPATG